MTSPVISEQFSGCLAASCQSYRTCHGKGLYCVCVVIYWKFLEFLGISGLTGTITQNKAGSESVNTKVKPGN